MRRIPIPAAAALAALLFLGFTAGYLFREIDQANAKLHDTQEALVQSRANRTAIVEAHNILVADLTALHGSLAEAETDRDTLRSEVHELSEQNRTLTHEKSVLTQEYDHLKVAHEELTTTHRQLTTRHLTLQADHADLNDQHSRLQQSVGTVEELETQAGALRTEIARLEERRRPLILADERVGGFYCTGSMNPAITCLDTATWLHDFQPEDIVAGATISFKSNACWPNDPPSSSTAHRVAAIRVIGGVYHYWPKGDANSKADGCWVPHTSVNGYMVEIHKNTRPQNDTLRNSVVAARNALDAAETTLESAENANDAASNAYDAARDSYLNLRRSYGCYSITVTCVVYSDAAYNALVTANQRADQAFAHYEQAFARYEQAFSRYERARAYYDCWYRNAKDSEYPGHIPYTC